MNLYFTPGTCSLAPNIVAQELGIALSLKRVDIRAKKVVESGADYLAVNPKGYVPALELDDGRVLTEGPVIAQYLADQKPEAKLAPANGTFERYQLQEMLAYLSAEVHKAYSPLFNPMISPEMRADRVAYLAKRYPLIEQKLANQQFLFGDQFTIADAYLFALTGWAPMLKVDISAFPNLRAFQERVAGRPSVKAALAAEKATATETEAKG